MDSKSGLPRRNHERKNNKPYQGGYIGHLVRGDWYEAYKQEGSDQGTHLVLVDKLEASVQFSEREIWLLRDTDCSIFGYDHRMLLALTDDELAEATMVVAKMLRLGTPFASVARWTTADLYERAFQRG